MAIKLKYKEKEHICNSITWDRESFFIDKEIYWSRVVATIAQKIAENTTSNWSQFNLIRNKVIKCLGVNLETGKIEAFSPILLLPGGNIHFIILAAIKDMLPDKSSTDLNILFMDLIKKSFVECKEYFSTSILVKSIEEIRNRFKDINISLASPDIEENNTFLISSFCPNFKSIPSINLEDILSTLENDNIFITGNEYLNEIFNHKKYKNFIFANNPNEIFCEILENKDLISINIDGASKGNPGPASIGIVFYKDKKSEIIKEVSEPLGVKSNNQAEYTALIRALEISLEDGYKNIEIFSDSELVVKQINKIYKIKDPNIKELSDKANKLINKLSSFKISYVPREENIKADYLANLALK